MEPITRKLASYNFGLKVSPKHQEVPMRRFLFVPAVFCIAAALLAQSSAPSDNKPTEDPTSAPCTVTGRVVMAAEGNPLKSARVALIPEHSRSHSQIYATSSDSDGRFTLKDIPPGRYRFFAAHAGFVEQRYKAGINDTGPLFSLRPGEKVSEVLFRPLDYVDLHLYPGLELTQDQYVQNFGFVGYQQQKPILMGEMGAFISSYPVITDAASALQNWQIQSCTYNFKGWLLWTWDTDEQPELWNARSQGGVISHALSPVSRMDPCSP